METDIQTVMNKAQEAWDTVLSWEAQAKAHLEEAQRLYIDAMQAKADNQATYLKVRAAYQEAVQNTPAPIVPKATSVDSSLEARLRNLEAQMMVLIRSLGARNQPPPNPPQSEPPEPMGSPVPNPKPMPSLGGAAMPVFHSS